MFAKYEQLSTLTFIYYILYFFLMHNYGFKKNNREILEYFTYRNLRKSQFTLGLKFFAFRSKYFVSRINIIC